MNISKIQFEISKLLFDACEKSIATLMNDMNVKVYAFVLYPSSGFSDFGLAVSTRESLAELSEDEGIDEELLESLKDHPDLLSDFLNEGADNDYYELTASE